MSGLCNEKINHREAGTIMLDLKETRGEIDRVEWNFARKLQSINFIQESLY